MKQRDKPYEEIYDLLAIRVLVNTVPDCYHALGVIHDGWTPVQERIKDYIAQPKSNGYQSLHTTVFGPGRQLYEIQIRTREMHRTADFGIAAHWLYKEDAKRDELDRHLAWFRQVLELQLDAKTPDEFLEFLKLDLYPGRDLRLHADGRRHSAAEGRDADRLRVRRAHGGRAALRRRAKVNGRIAPLSRQLQQLGDGRDHHVADAQAEPRLAGARAHGPRAAQDPAVAAARGARDVGEARAGDSRARGEASSAGEAGRRSSSTTAAKALSLNDATHLHRVDRAGRRQRRARDQASLSRTSRRRRAGEADGSSSGSSTACAAPKGVRIQGVDGLMVRYAQCCQPVPGDPVVGYVTRGRGVSIHRADCPNLLLLAHEPERRLEIDWQEPEGERFVVRLALEGNDRRGLYADVAGRRVEPGRTSAAWSSRPPTAARAARRSSRWRTSRTSRRSSRRRGG